MRVTKRTIAFCIVLLSCGLTAQTHQLKAEAWQGVNLVSVSSNNSRPGYSRGFCLIYRYQRKKSAISFETGVAAGAFRFRSDISTFTQMVANQVFFDLILSAQYNFTDRFSLGPALHFLSLSEPDVRFRNKLTRVTLGHSDFGPGYDHYPFQPAVGIVTETKLGENKRFSLKLLLIKHVTNLLVADYQVDFLFTPPVPQTVLPYSVKPAHLLLGLSWMLVGTKKANNSGEN